METSAVAGSDTSDIQMGDRLVMTVLSKRSKFDILQEPVCGGAPVVARWSIARMHVPQWYCIVSVMSLHLKRSFLLINMRNK